MTSAFLLVFSEICGMIKVLEKLTYKLSENVE